MQNCVTLKKPYNLVATNTFVGLQFIDSERGNNVCGDKVFSYNNAPLHSLVREIATSVEQKPDKRSSGFDQL